MTQFSKVRIFAGAALAAACLLVSPLAASAQTAAPSAAEVVKSMRPLSPMPRPGAMTDGFMKKIQERGRLVVGVNMGTYLFGYLNPITNQPEGFDVDIARQVAKAIFGDEKRIEFKAVVSATRLPMVMDGSVDMVVSTMTINAARKEQIHFSEVYYEAGQRILVAKNSTAKSVDDLSDKKVCLTRGSTSIKNIQTKNPRVVVVEQDEFTDCMVLFQQGKVDAVSSDDVILAGLAKQDPYAKVVGDKFTDEPYGIGVSKEHPEFVRFVNGVLSQMKADGTWGALYDKWLGGMISTTTPQPPKGSYNQ